MRNRWLPKPFPLNTRTIVYLWGVLALLLAFFLGTVFTWVILTQQLEASLDQKFDAALKGFARDFQLETQDLAALGNWLVAQESFVAQVRARDSSALTRTLEPLTEASIVDAIVVVDTAGMVLSRVKTGLPVTQGDNIIEQPGVRHALAGQSSSGMEQDSAGRLQGRLMLPLYDAPERSIVGVVILGFYLDGVFLQRVTAREDAELAIVYNDRITVTSLKDAQGKSWTGRFAPAAVLLAEREGHPTEILPLNTDQGQFLFKFQPLQSPSGSIVGMDGIGVPLAVIENERATLLKTFGLTFFSGILVLGLIGFLMARSLTLPLQALTRDVERLANGDLETPIALPRPLEMTQLARQMDLARAHLRTGLQASQSQIQKLEATVEAMPLGVMVTNPPGEIVVLNAAGEALLRQNRAALIGQPWQQILTMTGRADSVTPPFWDVQLDGGSGKGAVIVRGRFALQDHPHVVLNLVSCPFQRDGQSQGYVHVIQDVSAVEQFARAKDEFIFNVAHELRQPISAQFFSVGALVDEFATIDRRELGFKLRELQDINIRFQGLVAKLMDIGTVRAGRFRVEPIVYPLNRLVKDAVAQIESQLHARGQSLEIKLETPAECQVLADRTRVIQVIINLVTNASKYSPEGKPISLATRQEDGFAYIAISDCGPGISPDERAHIFERFWRSKQAEKEGEGIGLGLALANAIVKAHGGQIDVQSEPGKGSTFWFTLPEIQVPQL